MQGSAPLMFLAISLVLTAALAYTYLSCHGDGPADAVGGAASWAGNGISESSSGTLFRAIQVRTFSGPRLFADWKPVAAPPPQRGGRCKNWAVTTTIFAPTTTVKQIAALPDWCLVIAGDRKTPREYNVSGNAHYLSPADQERMPFATGKLLRWNHFGRKNLGFLHAISQGAKWVYDTDDDNELQSMVHGIPLPRPGALIEEVSTSNPLYNLYPQMSTRPGAWPRGFPLESIKDNRTYSATFAKRAWSAKRVGVVQSLADHDPDVDGIYRLTQPLPFTFPALSRSAATAASSKLTFLEAQGSGRQLMAQARRQLSRWDTQPMGARVSRLGGDMTATTETLGEAAMQPLGGSESGGEGRQLREQRPWEQRGSVKGTGVSKAALGRGGGHHRLVSLRVGTMMPYNAQATLHAYEALWGLLLPCTVHGRVTDIWRAYFTQRLLWDVGHRIAFSTPWVTQYRNAHNYLADFNSELPLYQQAGALVQSLLSWQPKATSLPGRVEELYIRMYEAALVGLDDVKLAQAWLADLTHIGYRFPPLEV